ncbi:outer membrane lipoprotein carrier protein LolA [Pedobacter sp. MC2016-14]|uniref:LolA family protein n=1 Tax=Pedobacter sp. MC2016-14 TaxID=2897327 RepID=UPI001E5B4820|nr:outer membrane lipoprotein carrier protein LolA [Pedobacter sp. MC2016-14]MCD0488770.1 outer membrane lipoprotein carrier protein LolA [Pedobacter sp. MC2016-14]
MKGRFFLILLIAGFTTIAFAQNDKDAKAKGILSEVSKKYKTYTAVKTGFSLTIFDPQTKTNHVENGTLYVKANTNKYKMVMKDRELISDGKNQWSYNKEDKEVQLTTVDKSSDAINPAQLFTIYEKGYKYLFTGESKIAGKVYQNIDLSPTDAKATYFKIKLSIDKAAKQISSITVLEKTGSKVTYAIKSFTANGAIPESYFTFDTKKNPGVEVVDLR